MKETGYRRDAALEYAKKWAWENYIKTKAKWFR